MLMNLKTALKRENLKFYLKDVLLIDIQQLLGCEDIDIPNLFWFKNYRQLHRTSYSLVEELQFEHLMDLDIELATDFFDRFPAIQYLSVAGSAEQDDLEWFLKNAKALTCLTLTNTAVDQTLMTSLPEISSRLTNLKVYGSSVLVNDFNFVLKLKQLEVFEVDQQCWVW